MHDGDNQHCVITTLINKTIAINEGFSKGRILEFRYNTATVGEFGDIARLGHQLADHCRCVERGITLDVLGDKLKVLEGFR